MDYYCLSLHLGSKDFFWLVKFLKYLFKSNQLPKVFIFSVPFEESFYALDFSFVV
jgi:hypothetical protein